MNPPALKIISCFIYFLLFVLIPGHAQDDNAEKQLEIGLRMIGHKLMLQSGDSTSRILPITKEGDRYRIAFDGEFGFVPEELVATIDKVIADTEMAKHYIVEVEACENGDKVYAFKVDVEGTSDIVACGQRSQPKGCYSLMFTILEPGEALKALQIDSSSSSDKNLIYIVVGLLVILAAVLYALFRRRKTALSSNPNLIPLGAYYFDKLNTQLIIEEQRIELTSKEADLLLLLYDSANTTVERDIILNKVWGDEGDYVGRTLDVFISKLRKKLEFDSKIKIKNIRGVGYKLVMDV